MKPDININIIENRCFTKILWLFHVILSAYFELYQISSSRILNPIYYLRQLSVKLYVSTEYRWRPCDQQGNKVVDDKEGREGHLLT